MSTCISNHGEFGSHHLDNNYCCQRCHVLDEDAITDELNRLRAELDASRAREEELQGDLNEAILREEKRKRTDAARAERTPPRDLGRVLPPDEVDFDAGIGQGGPVKRAERQPKRGAPSARAEQREALERAPTSNNDEDTRLNDAVVFLKSVVGDGQGAGDEWFAAQVRRMRDLFGFLPDARAERTEPATGEDGKHYHPCIGILCAPNGALASFGSEPPVTASDMALVAAATGGAIRSQDVRPEFVEEPATGEDVEMVARRLWAFDGHTRDSWDRTDGEGRRRVYVVARQILAALDLPGRERALREENERLRGRERRVWQRIQSWSDDPQARLEGLALGWERVEQAEAERDAANAALADVARLVDEARERLDEIKGLHCAGGTDCDECGHLWPCQTYQLTLPDTRQHAGGEGGGS